MDSQQGCWGLDRLISGKWSFVKRSPKERSAKAEVEEQIPEKGWCPGLKEQQHSEQEHCSQVEDELALVRMQQLLNGRLGCISWS